MKKKNKKNMKMLFFKTILQNFGYPFALANFHEHTHLKIDKD